MHRLLYARRQNQCFRRGIRLSTLIRPYRCFFATTSSKQPVDMEQVHTTERLAHLRRLMRQHNVDLYSETSNENV